MTTRTCVDAKTIIVNLLKEDRKDYLSIDRLQKLVNFIYMELSKLKELDKYQISFDINFYSIERTVQYNSDIFELDMDGECLRLKERKSAEALAKKYQADDTITKIIKDFQTQYAA